MFVAATCRIVGCGREALSGELCGQHLRDPRATRPCAVPGCRKPVSRVALGWCEMHFYRHRRHGDVDAVRQPKVFRKIDRGYVLLRMPEHPLANGRWVYEHRYLLYERLGAGPQQCWWCGRDVRWEEDLNVDHLDYDRSNNDLANLVPSCRACNMGRGAGCDREGWAVAMATRRVLSRHADEFEREVELMRARLDGVPQRASGARERSRVQQAHRGALAVYGELKSAAVVTLPCVNGPNADRSTRE
jgi:hypothetical protein